MSLNKRKSKQLTPIDSTQKRQSLQKIPLKLKKIQAPKPLIKTQTSKLRLKPLISKPKEVKEVIVPRPFEKFQKFDTPKQQKQMMSTFMTESSLFASYYKTQAIGWIKPSDYIVQISSINFLEDMEDNQDLQFKLNDNAKKNSQKVEKLYNMVAKWVGILKKAVFYTQSQKTNSDKLSEQLKFWKVLSKKFDELQYQFNDDKIKKLATLIDHYGKLKPQYNQLFQEFNKLKAEVCSLTIPIKKLYLALEDNIEPLINQFEKSESVLNSIQLLRQILSNLHNIFQDFKIIEGRKAIVYRKLNINLVRCLIGSNLNPSSVLDHIDLIDPSLSFLSNFISLMEQESVFSQSQIMSKAQYQQQVLACLFEMSMLFQFIDKQKKPQQLFIRVKQIKALDYSYNIFDQQNNDRWFQTVKIFQETKKYCPLFDEYDQNSFA